MTNPKVATPFTYLRDDICDRTVDPEALQHHSPPDPASSEPPSMSHIQACDCPTGTLRQAASHWRPHRTSSRISTLAPRYFFDLSLDAQISSLTLPPAYRNGCHSLTVPTPYTTCFAQHPPRCTPLHSYLPTLHNLLPTQLFSSCTRLNAFLSLLQSRPRC